jgi:UDP-N-acetylmuramate dehydrogenase
MELEVKGKLMLDEPLSLHSSLHLGGKAGYFLLASDADDISKTTAFAEREELPVLIIGKGSNILFSDEGFSGVVICTEKMKRIEVDGAKMIAEAGASLSEVIKVAKESSLSGIEELIGIPGSIGGAAVMNASAFNCEIGKYINAVKVLRNGKELNLSEFGFGYRESSLSDEIVLDVEFEFDKKEKKDIEDKIIEIMEIRRRKHPFVSEEIGTCGSVFKNPKPHSAGELIERAGCKGMNVGSVKVSEKHCNFFLTAPGATSEDFIDLIGRVRDKVKKNSRFDLELEVKIIGKEKEIHI